jgi:hypothetical protein
MDLDAKQRLATQSMKASSNFVEKGYQVKFKIPFILLGIEDTYLDKTEISELKASFVLNDIDNEFYPEQNTQIASSVFNQNDYRTFSTLLLIPKSIYFGENYSVFLEDVIRQLNEYGF